LGQELSFESNRIAPLIGARHRLSGQAALDRLTASAERSHRSEVTVGFGASAAYLLNEADIAPCGRDSASLRPFLSAGTEKALSLPKLGVHLISRAVRPRG
jgi:hypothetical protein